MIKQLRKVGNSNALLLNKPILELLGMESGSSVKLTVEKGSLIVTPVNPQAVDSKAFEAALDRVTAGRRRVLRKLAR